ncbi:hypothetical protein IJJ08_03870 [bacterium]|nr:hypothetical protein [bacterium]
MANQTNDSKNKRTQEMANKQASPAPQTPAKQPKHMCVVCAAKKGLSLKKGHYSEVLCEFCGERHTGGLETDFE